MEPARRARPVKHGLVAVIVCVSECTRGTRWREWEMRTIAAMTWSIPCFCGSRVNIACRYRAEPSSYQCSS